MIYKVYIIINRKCFEDNLIIIYGYPIYVNKSFINCDTHVYHKQRQFMNHQLPPLNPMLTDIF